MQSWPPSSFPGVIRVNYHVEQPQYSQLSIYPSLVRKSQVCTTAGGAAQGMSSRVFVQRQGRSLQVLLLCVQPSARHQPQEYRNDMCRPLQQNSMKQSRIHAKHTRSSALYPLPGEARSFDKFDRPSAQRYTFVFRLRTIFQYYYTA